jgi:hypothetical protein
MYTSSSSFLIPFCQWLADGCPTPVDIFSHYGKVKIFVLIFRNDVFITWKNPGHMVSWKEFCGAPGQSSLKPIKQEMSRETLAICDSNHRAVLQLYNVFKTPATYIFTWVWEQIQFPRRCGLPGITHKVQTPGTTNKSALIVFCQSSLILYF